MPNLMQNSGYNGVKVESYSSLDLADLTPGQLLMQLASALLDWEVEDQPVFDGCSAEQLADKVQHQMDWVLQSCKKPYSVKVKVNTNTKANPVLPFLLIGSKCCYLRHCLVKKNGCSLSTGWNNWRLLV